MYEELVIRCRDNGMILCGHMKTDFWDAADAIEELSRIVKEYQKFDGFLAAHGMFEQGPMIPIEPPKEEA